VRAPSLLPACLPAACCLPACLSTALADTPVTWHRLEWSRAFPSWNRSILTEIYLCNSCSDHEIHGHRTDTPNEVPDSFLSSNPSLDWPLRKTYEGMVHCLDSAIGNVTAALSAKGMWAQTLMVFSSDNVSTLQPIPPFDCHFAYTGSRSSPPSIRPTHTHSRARQGGREDADFGGNNYPLRGMKFSAWEGGVRVAAWISGGALPAARRGQSEAGLIAICDWRATFAALAGAHAFDFKVRRGRRPRPSFCQLGTTVAPLN
jgi:hypothetical protein